MPAQPQLDYPAMSHARARAQAFLNEVVQSLAERGRSLLGRSRAAIDPTDLPALGELLLSRRGEASGVVLARTLLESYAQAPPSLRLAFLTALAERFGPDPARLAKAIAAFQREGDPELAHQLHVAAEPRRQELIRRLNLAPGGTFALVKMREELMQLLPAHPELRPLDADFVHLLSSWFNPGFLMLRRIDWRTPAVILEKIIRYEAVHAIANWDDLRNRLEPPDRRCFGFFHPQLVDEPLIFVEVALTAEIPAAVAPLLDLKRQPIAAEDATTAVFYSISNTQKGLASVSFGNFLIKQVVEDLQRELPGLGSFVTLSPVPGFAAWLAGERKADAGVAGADELRALDDPLWLQDPAKLASLQKVLPAAAAAYLLKAKGPGGKPLDPVARFHLGNGARLERINFLGDPSPKGMRESHGIMVNYLYDPGEIESNHEAFVEKGQVAAAPALRKLLRGGGARREGAPGR